MRCKKLFIISLALAMLLATIGCATPIRVAGGSEKDLSLFEFKEMITLAHGGVDVAALFNDLSDEYLLRTGVRVAIETLPEIIYAEVLKPEVLESASTTIFQLNNPSDWYQFQPYCSDLSQTKLCHLIDTTNLLYSDENCVYAVPYQIPNQDEPIYLAINNNVSEEDQLRSLDFLEWLLVETI